jgi:hypothetical protein
MGCCGGCVPENDKKTSSRFFRMSPVVGTGKGVCRKWLPTQIVPHAFNRKTGWRRSQDEFEVLG